MRKLFVAVETDGDYCKGATVADRFGVTGQAPNVNVILDIDREAFVQLLVEAAEHYSEEVQA